MTHVIDESLDTVMVISDDEGPSDDEPASPSSAKDPHNLLRTSSMKNINAIRSGLSDAKWFKEDSPESARPSLSPRTKAAFKPKHNNRQDAIHLACHYIDMALRDRATSVTTTYWAGVCHTIRKNRWYRWFIRLNVVCQLLLVIIEPPSYRAAEDDATQDKIEKAVGSISVTIQMVDVGIRALPFGWRHFKQPWSFINALVVLINAADVVCHLAMATTFRFSRALRPVLFMAQSRTLRRSLSIVLQSFIPVIGVAVVFFVAVAAFSYLGVLFFRGLYVYAGDEIPAGDFDHLSSSLLTHFALITTENYPFIMFPAMDHSKWSVIHFIIFCLMHLVFISLLLGVVYDSYKEAHTNVILRTLVKEKRNFLLAFQVLDEDNEGVLTFEHWCEILPILRPGLTATQTRLLFDLVDKDGDGRIDALEFCVLADMMKWKFKNVSRSYSHRMRRRFVKIDGLKAIVRGPVFRNVMKVVVLLNAFMLVAYTEADKENRSMLAGQYVMLFVFVIEFVVKFLADGDRYWDVMWNRYDFIISLLGVFFFALYQAQLTHDFYNITVFRTFDFFRVSQPVKGTIGKLLFLDERISNFLFSVRQSTYVVTALGSLMFFIMYTWSIIGMELFEGALKDIEDQYEIKQSNFDSWPYAMLALFQILMENNWNDVMYAYIKGSGSNYASWFFTTYYMIQSTVMLDLFIGLMIECFTRPVEDAGNIAEVFTFLDEDTNEKMSITRPRRWSREIVKAEINELYDNVDLATHVRAIEELEKSTRQSLEGMLREPLLNH